MLGIRVLLDIPGWGPAKWAVELLAVVALRLVHHPQLNRVLVPTVALELAHTNSLFVFLVAPIIQFHLLPIFLKVYLREEGGDCAVGGSVGLTGVEDPAFRSLLLPPLTSPFPLGACVVCC